MNRLQKKAWTELTVSGIAFVVIAVPAFLIMAQHNVKGWDYLLIFLIVAVPAGLIGYIHEMKKLKEFDEREREVIRKAQSISMAFFVLFQLAFAYTAFFLLGGKGNIAVVILPIMVFSGAFIAQCVQSAILLIQCEKEDNE